MYKNITTDDDHTIFSSGSGKGSINFIKITNQSNSLSTLVTIFLRDVVTGGNPTYDIVKTMMPPETNLLLDQKSLLSYDGRKFEMKITTLTAGGDANLDIIIK